MRDGYLQCLSYGGGLDSWVMLLQAVARGEKPDVVVMANVADKDRQDPGEWPSTWDHVDHVVKPFCAEHGIPFHVIETDEFPIRGERSLFAYMERMNQLPTRQSRLCTVSAKVERVTAWLMKYYPGLPAEMWIGFEAGEENRANSDPHSKDVKGFKRRNRFPLMEEGLCRCRCEAIARASGHPVPRKSACVFCPFSKRGDFQLLAQVLPHHFVRIERLEANAKVTKAGKILVYGYEKGDGTDPKLREWALKPYKAKQMGCGICGATTRATKATGCDQLQEQSYSHAPIPPKALTRKRKPAATPATL